MINQTEMNFKDFKDFKNFLEDNMDFLIERSAYHYKHPNPYCIYKTDKELLIVKNIAD